MPSPDDADALAGAFAEPVLGRRDDDWYKDFRASKRTFDDRYAAPDD